MITKAIITSINAAGDRCTVRMPLFETAASSFPVKATALVSITPGVYNNLSVGDVVFVAFEENAIEKPIIIGKLFKGGKTEGSIRGGGGVFNSLKITSSAALPSSTSFAFPAAIQSAYKNFTSPKDTADYIKWLEDFTKSNFIILEEDFSCFKNWTQWQLQAENVEIDDGDLDSEVTAPEPFKYQKEGGECKICDNCPKANSRSYSELDLTKSYPNT